MHRKGKLVELKDGRMREFLGQRTISLFSFHIMLAGSTLELSGLGSIPL